MFLKRQMSLFLIVYRGKYLSIYFFKVAANFHSLLKVLSSIDFDADT